MTANDFLMNLDNPLEKIIYIKSSSRVVADGVYELVDILHNIPSSFLPLLQWSNTSDFAITQTWYDNPLQFSYGSIYQGMYAVVNQTKLSLTFDNHTGSSKTFYYKVFGLPVSTMNVNSIIPFTTDLADNFVLNSESNYMKLFKADRFNSAGSFNHGLGYIPRVVAWGQTLTDTYEIPLVIGYQTSPTGIGNGGVSVTDQNISWDGIGGYSAIEYRIYLDN